MKLAAFELHTEISLFNIELDVYEINYPNTPRENINSIENLPESLY